MLSIGDFSKLAQVSIKTLRYYGERELFKPAWIDRTTGYRYYAFDQLPRLNRILALKDLGFSLDQIKDLLRSDLPLSELQGMMRMKRVELERQLLEGQAQLARIEARLFQIQQEGSAPKYEVIRKSVPAQWVVGIRDMVPSYGYVSALYDELSHYLQSQRISLDTTHPCIGVYYDGAYRERDVDIEIAAPVPRSVTGSGRIRARELPAVETMACVVYRGGYEQLPRVYNGLMSWIEATGHEIAGPTRDVFLRRPHNDGDPADLITEVQFPVKEKPYLSVVKQYQEQTKMKPEIVTKPAFTVVGLMYHGKNENDEIPELWNTLNPRFPEIKHKIKPNLAYGVCGEVEEGGDFKYLAGFAVSSIADIPDGMTSWAVPEQKYAVFPCTLKTIGETYRYIHQTWLPESGYKRVDGPDFEFYDEELESKDSTLYVYVPVN